MTKFKVGDKVINKTDLDFLFNPYHKESYRKKLIQTVTEANDKFFSIYKPTGRYTSVIKQALTAGANNFMIFNQSDGTCFCWASRGKMLHVSKDKEYIVSRIQSIGMAKLKEEKANIQSNIVSLQIRLDTLQTSLANTEKAFINDMSINLNLLEDESNECT